MPDPLRLIWPTSIDKGDVEAPKFVDTGRISDEIPDFSLLYPLSFILYPQSKLHFLNYSVIIPRFPPVGLPVLKEFSRVQAW